MEVIIVIITILVVILLIKKKSSDLKFQKCIEKTKPYLEILSRKEKQLVTKDDYGNYNYNSWFKEVSYFLENTLDLPYQCKSKDELKFREAVFNKVCDLVEEHTEKTSKEQLEKLNNGENIFIFKENMSPLDYEYFCKDILVSNGFDARVTKQSGDQGADIICYLNNIPFIVIQCKLYSKAVGNKAIQEISAAKHHYGAKIAIVVTNNTYTKSAKELANTNSIYLLHHENLYTFNNDDYLE